MNDPNQPMNVDENINLKGGGSGKTVGIVIAVVVVAGLGFLGYSAKKKHDDRKFHASFMTEFASVEKDELAAKFWACVLGPNIDPGTIPDNLALGARIEQAFGADMQNYPSKVREECTAKGKDAKNKLTSLAAPPEYDEAVKKYAKAFDEMLAQFDAWAQIAPAQVAEKKIAKRVEQAGAAWHSFAGGKPDADVSAFDRFIHCSVPGLDGMKDSQEMLQYIFEQCKKPEYSQKLNETCGKELTAPATGLDAPTAGFSKAVGKFGADDRDLQAFDDCLRKGRKSKRKDDFEGIGRAFVAAMEASKEVRKIGAEALKE